MLCYNIVLKMVIDLCTLDKVFNKTEKSLFIPNSRSTSHMIDNIRIVAVKMYIINNNHKHRIKFNK